MAEENEFITSDIDKINSCVNFMKLFLSLLDDLQKRGLDPVEAADQGNIFMANWFNYACGQETISQFSYSPED